jgi:hypothetical protein
MHIISKHCHTAAITCEIIVEGELHAAHYCLWDQCMCVSKTSCLCGHGSETESRPPGLEGLIATRSDHHGSGEFDGARAGGIGGPCHWLALSNVTPYHLPSPHHVTSHNIT